MTQLASSNISESSRNEAINYLALISLLVEKGIARLYFKVGRLGDNFELVPNVLATLLPSGVN